MNHNLLLDQKVFNGKFGRSDSFQVLTPIHFKFEVTKVWRTIVMALASSSVDKNFNLGHHMSSKR